jgi:pyridoxal phosphate enzyme (YggS family)
MFMSIAEQLASVQTQISDAARAAARHPSEIRLIGVSKTHPAEIVAEAIAQGLVDLGENRVQEAEGKISALAADRARLRWHLIGHLQSNKARKAAQIFDMIQSVDSLRLAEQLDRHAGEVRATRLPILLQVNVSGEQTKEGFDLANWPSRTAALDAFVQDVEQILALTYLHIQGLMTIAPLGQPGEARPHFASTRALRDQLAMRFPEQRFPELSMGMSNDFGDAIAEGATMVRIGRAIFGAR